MISAFANIFKVPDLRVRVLFTLAIIVIVRIGSQLTTPGVNVGVLASWFDVELNQRAGGTVAALLNIFSGGSLENCAIFSLGIMPYISASIMMQLLSAVVPRLAKLRKEDGGQQKIMQYTRYATLVLCVFQGYLLALSFENPSANPFLPNIQETINRIGIPLVPDPGWTFRLITIMVMTAGTMLLMWLGDQITDKGVGNGVSIIITIGIVARLPAALMQAWKTFVPSGGQESTTSPFVLVLMIMFLLVVIAAVISVTQAQRKIAITYAKRVVGRKVFGGQTQYLPLKVNYAGVMPIIFAQAILIFPSTIIQMVFKESRFANELAQMLATGWLHYLLYAVMIFFFSYFWVATQFQPTEISENLKKQGGYIPGQRPGKATAEFLEYTMTRLTFAGAIFLTVIAILPEMVMGALKVPYNVAQFFGGTSLLILVGVVLDTMRQLETKLLEKQYDGFLRKGPTARNRYAGGVVNAADDTRSQNIVWLYVGAAVLVIGLVAYLLSQKSLPS